MKSQISVLIPGIRPHYWTRIFHSLKESTKRTFELVFVGPYTPPGGLERTKFIQDWGSPTRCFNMGLEICEGELLISSSDDGVFLPGALDRAVDAFEAMSPHPKNVLILKYTEHTNDIQPDSYFKLVNAYPRVLAAQEDWWIYNFTLNTTEYFKYLGGLDSRYEVGCVAQASLGLRSQRDGAITKIFPEPIVHNDWGLSDHVPIERGQVENDEPLYKHIHNDPNDCVNCIDIKNWQLAPPVWKRRFGDLQPPL